MAKKMAISESSHKLVGPKSDVNGNSATSILTQRKICAIRDRQHDGGSLSQKARKNQIKITAKVNQTRIDTSGQIRNHGDPTSHHEPTQHAGRSGIEIGSGGAVHVDSEPRSLFSGLSGQSPWGPQEVDIFVKPQQPQDPDVHISIPGRRHNRRRCLELPTPRKDPVSVSAILQSCPA